ncbi:DUF4270 family protein [Salinimicrobium sp. TIG7-5_MAKvit]|uniref:DUF4270 family protein n=1 Tax=Salinimicrobium sp. TIG7-5_MAKvit TaxID=3121289 RepID=UPI003C6E60AA
MNRSLIQILQKGGILLLLFLSACSEDDSLLNVGEDWANTSTEVYSIDTLTVKASTFKFDSISVSGTDRLLIGAYSDRTFGVVKSEAYLQLNPSGFTIDSKGTFDSIALILKYDGYFYNDTLQTQKFTVAEVLEDIEPDDDGDYYYNTTDFNYSEENLATKNFTPYLSRDSLYIKLNDDYGQEIFNRIQSKNITSSEEFLREYQGLIVQADSGNSAIFGFSKDSYVRIFYTVEQEAEDEENELDFSLSSTNSFHHVSSNFSNTYFDAIENKETYLPSTATNDQIFIQSGLGIATRIDIPYLERLNDIEGTGTIIEANLKISLDQTEANKNHFTRDSLQFYIINQRSEIVGQLTDYNSATVQGLIEEEDDEFSTLTYTVPLKYYIDTKMTDINGSKWYFAMYSQNFNSSIDRYIFYGENAPDPKKIKLELTYALYDE